MPSDTPNLASVEYRVFQPHWDQGHRQVEHDLNELADAGWRVITATARNGAWLVLERERPDAV